MKTHNFDIKANQINKFDERWYEIELENEKKYFRSVTTFLEVYPKGTEFYKWMKSVGHNVDRIIKESAEFGTLFHEAIQKILTGDEVNYLDYDDNIRLWERLMIWAEFWKEFNKEHEIEFYPNSVEKIIYDLENEYAGQVDLIPWVDKKPVIIDWKSGNYIGDTAKIQISAYAKATEKFINEPIETCYIAHFPEKKPNKKGYRIYTLTKDEIDEYFERFKNTQKIYYYTHQNEKPKFKTYPASLSLKIIGGENESERQ